MKRAICLVTLLAACNAPAPEAQGPTLGERLGVPRGEVLFTDAEDAATFDGHVERFAPLSCTTLNSTVAALNAQGSRRTTAGRLANAGAAVVPGPVGSLGRLIGSEVAAASAERGNLQLSAAEAVRAAKNC